MKNRLRFLLIMCVMAVLAPRVARAQAPQTIEVGPHVGGTSYVGDLNVWRNLRQWDWKQLNEFHYALGGVVRYNYDSRWSFRLDYTYLKVRARDNVTAWRPQSLLNFKTTAHDLSMVVEFNFLDYYTGKEDKGFSPYIFGGVSGLMYHVQPFTGIDNVDALYINNLHEGTIVVNDQEVGVDEFTVGPTLEGHNFALSIPFGLGCKLSVSEHLGATFEWRMHYTLTDYFDGVHSNYAKEHVVVEGYDFTDPTGTFPEGYQRGNPRNNDWFGMVNLSLTWKFIIPDSAACKITDH